MNRILLFSALLLIGVYSCKKDKEDTPLGTISATVGGVDISFNVSAKATEMNVQNGFGIKIHGYKKDPTVSSTDMELIVVSPSPIVSALYTENANDNPLVEIYHFQELIFGAGSTCTSYHSPTNPVTVNITSITSSAVKGTFQGELETPNLQGGGTSKIVVTNGVFHVSF